MRRVELTGLFTGISGKIADEVFINKAENIVVLLAIGRDILNKLNQFADCLGLIAGAVTKFAQTGFQRIENFAKYLF